MNFDEYKAELEERMKDVDWRDPKGHDSTAYKLLVQASRDGDINAEEFGKLCNRFYR